MLSILKEEFRHAMMLAGKLTVLCIESDIVHAYYFELISLGCAKISDIKPELVVHESFYKVPRNKL